MTRILIYGINFSPELTGIGKYTGELANFLAEQGHHVKVVTGYPYYPEWRISDHYPAWRYQRQNLHNIEVIRCPLWVPKRPTGLTRIIHLLSFAFFSLPAMIWQICWKPQVILCIVPAMICAPSARLVAWLARCPVWLHIQDFELEAAIRLKILPRMDFFYRLLLAIEKELIDSFDKVSTISNSMMDLLHKKGISPKKTDLIPNWVDCNEIYPMSQVNPLRSAWKVGEDNFVVLYSGTMGEKQGLDILIKAAKLLQDNSRITFLMVGEGSAKEKIKSMANGEHNIRFFPLQPYEQFNALLNLADVHILPQRADAADLVMPSKLTAMLASGKAVIACTNPETELGRVVQSIGVIVPPEKPSTLASAIVDLYTNPHRRAEIGSKGRSFALNNWSKPDVLMHFISKLEELIRK